MLDRDFAAAMLLRAPFAFASGAIVRDGRELLYGALFCLLGLGVAAFGFASGTPLAAVPAALTAIFILAMPATMSRGDAGPVPSTRPTQALFSFELPLSSPPVPLHPRRWSGIGHIHLLWEFLETADRIGEFRHRRHLRKLRRQQAAHHASTAAALCAGKGDAGRHKRTRPRAGRQAPLQAGLGQ